MISLIPNRQRPHEEPKTGVLVLGEHSLGLTNQLNRILNSLLKFKARGVGLVAVTGFRPDMFERREAPLSTVIDIRAANQVLRREGLPLLSEEVKEVMRRERPIVIRGIGCASTLDPKHHHLSKVLKPSASLISMAEPRVPQGQFDTLGLRFGVDEIDWYLRGGDGYLGLVDWEPDQVSGFEAWAGSAEGMAALREHVESALSFVDEHFDGSKPVYICTAVGKDPRHASMEKYVEMIIERRPFLIWDKSAPDSRREICAMVDACVAMRGGKHAAFPSGSTLSVLIDHQRRPHR